MQDANDAEANYRLLFSSTVLCDALEFQVRHHPDIGAIARYAAINRDYHDLRRQSRGRVQLLLRAFKRAHDGLPYEECIRMEPGTDFGFEPIAGGELYERVLSSALSDPHVCGNVRFAIDKEAQALRKDMNLPSALPELIEERALCREIVTW